MDLRISDLPEAAAAAEIAQIATESVHRRGRCTIAVSGGSTAPAIFAALGNHSLPWERIGVWQVDERVVPDGHPDRNAAQLEVLPVRAHLMPVTEPDLVTAAVRYGSILPERFDLVHLGVGADGHTASWIPGRSDLWDVPDPVTLTPPFHGHRRMTLTLGVVLGARQRIVVAAGVEKASWIARWAVGDETFPFGRVPQQDTICHLDPAAAAELAPGADQ